MIALLSTLILHVFRDIANDVFQAAEREEKVDVED